MQTARSTSSTRAAGLTFRAGSRHTVEIDAARTSVWDALTDAEHHEQWLGNRSTIVEATWPRARRAVQMRSGPNDRRSSDRVIRWQPAPRVILHTTRPDGVVARLEFELHALPDCTLVVLHEVALHPGPPTRRRPAPWRTRHWSRRSLASLRRIVEESEQRGTVLPRTVKQHQLAH